MRTMELLETDAGQAVVLRADERPLFGIHNGPRGPVQRSVGIVLCNPVGYESLSVYRTYRHMAEALAQSGFHVLRFDYHGTGNSGGPCSAAGPCADDVGAAIDELKARTGVHSVCLIGLRAGALFALTAAASRADVASLVLWAMPASGRAHIRELVAFQRLSGEPSEGPEVRIAGFLLSDAMLSELRGIDPAVLVSSGQPLSILALRRDDMEGDDKVADGWRAAGHQVVSTAAPGYVEMMTLTEFSVVPAPAISLVCDWATRVHDSVEPLRRLSDSPSTGPWLRADTDVLECGVRFGPNERLFGVLSMPRTTPNRAPNAAVVITNTGANHHIGTGRSSVKLARSLAQRGVTVLRFDASGIGESHASSGRNENHLYSDDAAFNVSEALRYLQAQQRSEAFVLVGLCAGAYMALRSALVEPRVVGQVLVNLTIFEPTAAAAYQSGSFKARKVYRDALFDPKMWRRLFAGRVAVVPIARHLLKQAVRQLTAVTRSRVDAIFRPGATTDPVERDFRALGRRGTRTLMVHGSEDASLDALAIVLGEQAERIRDDPHFGLQLVSDADHVFTRALAQRQLHASVEAFVMDIAF
ncbi:MAG: hypothetical protein JWN04_4586 [Myxococcaceae bacterium]|nr:hypothetical protein [Myxococcaceae bacterium]